MKPFISRILSSLDIRSSLLPAENNVEQYAPFVFLVGIFLLCYVPFFEQSVQHRRPPLFCGAHSIFRMLR